MCSSWQIWPECCRKLFVFNKLTNWKCLYVSSRMSLEDEASWHGARSKRLCSFSHPDTRCDHQDLSIILEVYEFAQFMITRHETTNEHSNKHCCMLISLQTYLRHFKVEQNVLIPHFKIFLQSSCTVLWVFEGFSPKCPHTKYHQVECPLANLYCRHCYTIHRVKWRHTSVVAMRSPFCRSTRRTVCS